MKYEIFPPVTSETVLRWGVAELISETELTEKLNSGQTLRIKLGIDPTSPNIHIGRAVVLHKLRQLQQLGHQVVLILGNFTGQIGDTSDKDSERPMLDEAVVTENLKNYLAQAGKLLDLSKIEVHYNADWLANLSLSQIGHLADAFSVHDFITRENIKKRLDGGKRVSLRELLYPLMQGYDSVVVKADIELGGTDQKFNILAGRILQTQAHQSPQSVILMRLLMGLDGRKMSSSWGNTVNIADEPGDMFGKIMSMRDEVIIEALQLATCLSSSDIQEITELPNPRDQKLILAEVIVSMYHSPELAVAARQQFLAQFSRGELPEHMSEINLSTGDYSLVNLLLENQLVESKTEARRLLEQGGIYLDQVTQHKDQISLQNIGSIVLQVGKRKFLKINIQ